MQTIVITGATSGIGYEAAAQLAEQGHRVVLVGRDQSRTHAAAARLQQRCGIADGSAQAPTYALADFSSLASVRALATELLERLPRIDVLVNNAGGVNSQRRLTIDGYEATFAVNHLAPFLLTALLRDRITAGGSARIVTTASAAHHKGTMELDDLGSENGYSIMAAYGRSKLANIMFTRSLARRLEGTEVTANCLHPGTVRTHIWSGAPWFARPVLAVAKLRMDSVPKGAGKITYLATSPEVAEVSGEYFDDNQVRYPSRSAQDDELGERLWNVSEQLVGLR